MIIMMMMIMMIIMIMMEAGLYPYPTYETILYGRRRGTNGVSTNGVTAKFMFFDRDFGGTPVNLPLSSQKRQGVPFSPTCQKSLLLQRPHSC